MPWNWCEQAIEQDMKTQKAWANHHNVKLVRYGAAHGRSTQHTAHNTQHTACSTTAHMSLQYATACIVPNDQRMTGTRIAKIQSYRLKAFLSSIKRRTGSSFNNLTPQLPVSLSNGVFTQVVREAFEFLGLVPPTFNERKFLIDHVSSSELKKQNIKFTQVQPVHSKIAFV